MNKPMCLLRLDNYYFTLLVFIYNDVTKVNDLIFIKSIPNNNQNNYESSNFLQTDLKIQLNTLINCFKKNCTLILLMKLLLVMVLVAFKLHILLFITIMNL